MSKENWKELTIGTINLDAGNSVRNLTGTWRSGQKPEFLGTLHPVLFLLALLSSFRHPGRRWRSEGHQL